MTRFHAISESLVVPVLIVIAAWLALDIAYSAAIDAARTQGIKTGRAMARQECPPSAQGERLAVITNAGRDVICTYVAESYGRAKTVRAAQ